jgi:hypothetical protein
MRVFVGLSLLLTSALAGAAVQVEVDPNQVVAGGKTQMTVRVTGRGRVDLVDLGLHGFKPLADRGTSRNTMISIVNGRQQVTQQTEFRYILRAPDSTGRHRIGPVQATVGGVTESAPPIDVLVVSADRAASAQRAEGNLFLRFEVEPPNPYVGQQFTVTSYLYSRVRVEGVRSISFPEAKGVWWVNLDDKTRGGSAVVELGGVAFRRHFLGRTAGFADRAGEVVLAGGSAIVQILDGDLFRGGVTERQIQAEARRVTLRPLPPRVNAQQVGTYRVRGRLDRDSVNVGDIVELTVEVSGAGNIDAFPIPKVDLPEGLRGFSPKRSVESSKDPVTVGGTLTWTLPIQARAPGLQRIPELEVVWFDPAAPGLKRVSVGPFALAVEGSALVPADPQPGPGRTMESHASSSFGPVGGLRPAAFRFGSAHPIWLILLGGLLLGAYWPKVRVEEGATAVAPRAAGDVEEALQRVLGIPVRGLTREAIEAAGRARLSPEHAEQLCAQLARVSRAAYSPDEQAEDLVRAELIAWLEAL